MGKKVALLLLVFSVIGLAGCGGEKKVDTEKQTIHKQTEKEKIIKKFDVNLGITKENVYEKCKKGYCREFYLKLSKEDRKLFNKLYPRLSENTNHYSVKYVTINKQIDNINVCLDKAYSLDIQYKCLKNNYDNLVKTLSPIEAKWLRLYLRLYPSKIQTSFKVFEEVGRVCKTTNLSEQQIKMLAQRKAIQYGISPDIIIKLCESVRQK